MVKLLGLMCNATLVQFPSTHGYSRASRRTRQHEWSRDASYLLPLCSPVSGNWYFYYDTRGGTEQKIRAHTIYTHNEVTQEVISYAMFLVRYISPPLSSRRPRPGSYHTFLACSSRLRWVRNHPPSLFDSQRFCCPIQNPLPQHCVCDLHLGTAVSA